MIAELLTTGFFCCSVYLFVVGLANAFAVYDLKNDRLNPVEAAGELNRSMRIETYLAGAVTVLTLASGYYVLSALTVPLSAAMFYLRFRKKYTVDPTEVFQLETISYIWRVWLSKAIYYAGLLVYSMVLFMMYVIIPTSIYLFSQRSTR